jgi:hypothetical protein
MEFVITSVSLITTSKKYGAARLKEARKNTGVNNERRSWFFDFT